MSRTVHTYTRTYTCVACVERKPLTDISKPSAFDVPVCGYWWTVKGARLPAASSAECIPRPEGTGATKDQGSRSRTSTSEQMSRRYKREGKTDIRSCVLVLCHAQSIRRNLPRRSASYPLRLLPINFLHSTGLVSNSDLIHPRYCIDPPSIKRLRSASTLA